MVMQAQDLPDLLNTARAKAQKANFTLLDKRRTEFVAYPTFFRKSMVEWAGGNGTYEFNVLTKIPDTASWTGVWDEDVLKRQNVWTKGRVYMRHLKNYWVYDQLERLLNQGEDQLVDEVKALRFQCMMGIAHLMEDVIVTGPTDSSDNLKPDGFNTLFTRHSTVEGFDQSNVTGFPSGRSEIDSTNSKYSGHANWCGHWSNWTYEDFVEMLIRGCESTGFKMPISNANVLNPNQARLAWYTGLTSKMGWARVVRDQNDQVGKDSIGYYDTFLFRGAPVKRVAVLDDDTDGVIFGINHDTVKSASLRGNVFRESGPKDVPGNHNAVAYWVDCSWQMFCNELRANMTFVKV